MILEDGEVYDIDDVLHSSQCECGEELTWYWEDDNWQSFCNECERNYTTSITKVTVNITNFDTEDNEEFEPGDPDIPEGYEYNQRGCPPIIKEE